jgi:hypothetical protein
MSDYYIRYTYLLLNLFLKQKEDYTVSSIIYKLLITKYYLADQIEIREGAEHVVRIGMEINE